MGKGIFQQQQQDLYAVNLSSPGGVLSVEQLAGLASVAEELDVHAIKCGTRQTLVVLIKAEQVNTLIESVEHLGLRVAPFGNTVRNVKACAGGAGLCPRQLGGALELGIAIENKYLGQHTPKDFKISTAGCARGCTEPYCADFGAIAIGKDTFNIVIGGRGSTKNPVHGTIIVKNIHQDQVFNVLDFVLEKYRQHGQPHERLCSTIKRVGCEEFIPPAGLYHSDDNSGIDEDFVNFLMADE